jgi:hypothetical protein
MIRRRALTRPLDSLVGCKRYELPTFSIFGAVQVLFFSNFGLPPDHPCLNTQEATLFPVYFVTPFFCDERSYISST